MNVLDNAERLRRARVRRRTQRAIRLGKLVRPDTCQNCGHKPGPIPWGRAMHPGIESHHPDHNEVLSVVWLCIPCHRRADLAITNARRGKAA